MDSLDDETALKEWARTMNVEVYDMDEIYSRGSHLPHIPPKGSDLAAISYTSGTTGIPKGAMITHENHSYIPATFQDYGIKVLQTDKHISYLPLAHCFERGIHVLVISQGGRIGFYSGDVLKLVEDIQILKPNLFASVPRLYNKIYDKIFAQTINAEGLKGALFRRAFSAKQEKLEQGRLTHPIYDILFRKVAQVLGGEIRLLVTGSAPISSQVLNLFRICFSCDMLEGYGATETCAFGTITLPGDFSSGNVGLPPACVELKLVDVPEMNYKATDKPFPRGEVCIRGPFIFKGYYKDKQQTSQALDEDNWYHTGDIGMWTGKLSLIDRKKNIFKLSQGEYITPEKLENNIVTSKYIQQAFVYGDSLEDVLVAIIVPDFEVLQTKYNIQDPKEIVKNPKIRALIAKELEQISSKFNLMGFEMVRNFYLESEPFSAENSMLTPTFKLKRAEAKEKYKNIIKEMYDEYKGNRGSKL